MQKVVILGATSGIAQAVQRRLAADGIEMLLVGRSPERLETVCGDLLARGSRRVLTYPADLADTSGHRALLDRATRDFGDFDTLLLAYGTMLDQAACQASPEVALQELNTNFTSAVALLTAFGEYLRQRGSGTIAVITSVAGDRGRRPNYVYGAAKGGLSIFLQGLRSRLYSSHVRVLTIKPGPVNTAMTANMTRNRLFVEPEAVAADIHRALKNGRTEVLYTPWFWRWIMMVLRAIPERSFKKLSV